MLSRKNEKLYIPVNVLASSLSILVPSLVETQVKCRGSTSRSPVREVKLPSAAAQLLIFPFPERETCICTVSQCFLDSEISSHEVSKGTTKCTYFISSCCRRNILTLSHLQYKWKYIFKIIMLSNLNTVLISQTVNYDRSIV